MDPLLHELLIATGLVSATVVVHLVGLDVLQLTLRWHLRRLTGWVHLDRMVVPVGIVLGLFIVHGAEIWLYALVYWQGHVAKSLEAALVASIETYSTLGAGGGFPPGWRVVGALESINGMLLIGWSTAFLFAILRHLMWEDEADGALPRGAIARRRGNRKA
ncbi:MAG: two pore domain potassium channel family protein [Proteobacteria bacterium]|nr:two pore domain potassium channel family protein [Pseudomonadota bacterium]